MKLKYGLLASAISEAIYDTIRTHVAYDALNELDIDVNEIVNTMAIKVLTEIYNVVQKNKISDSDAVEEIVSIFEKYDISVFSRRDV